MIFTKFLLYQTIIRNFSLISDDDGNKQELFQFYRKYYSTSWCVNLINLQDNSPIITELIKSIEPPLVIYKNNTNNTVYGDYLIISSNLEDFTTAYRQLSHRIWTKNRLYSILILTPMNYDGIGRILRELWTQFWTIKINIVIFQKYNNIHVYRPFEIVNNSRGIVQIYDSTRFMIEKNYELKRLNNYELSIKIFKRIPTAIRHIPANMVDLPIYQHQKGGYYGLDGTILSELSKQMDFTIKIVDLAGKIFGDALSNGTITGTLNLIVKKQIDMAANGYFLNYYQTDQIEFTTPYFYEQICVLAPKSERVPQYMAIFHCFQRRTWCILLITDILSVCFWLIFVKFKHKPNHNRNIDALMVLFSVPINTKKHNLFLGSLMLFNVIIVGLFQGNLVKSFSVVRHYPDINTLQELDKSNLKISTSLNVFNNDSHSPLIRNLYRKITRNYRKSREQAAYKRNVVALERQRDAHLFRLLYKSNDGVPLLHIVNDCPISYHIVYILPKNSPFLTNINRLLTIFNESGLIQKWSNDLIDSIIIEVKFRNPENVKIEKAFSLYDIQSAFIIWIFGVILSIICYFCEHLYRQFRVPILL